MPADHAAPRTLTALPSAQRAQASRRILASRGRPGLPPFWWFLPSVALGLCFWIVVLALLLG